MDNQNTRLGYQNENELKVLILVLMDNQNTTIGGKTMTDLCLS